MPSVPSERIAKGSVLRKVDNAVNAQNAKGVFSRREELLYVLKSIQPEERDRTADYLRFLTAHVPGISQAEREYLEAYYFSCRGEPSLWHPLALSEPIEPIVRLGLIKAIEEAHAHNLPLDSYWEAADTDSVFETIVICSAHQVTRLIRTPHPTAPTGHPDALMNDAPIFLCKQGEHGVIIRDLRSRES